MLRRRFAGYTALLCALLLLFAGCAVGGETKETITFFAMDTYVQITAYGENASQLADALQQAKNLILELEQKFDPADENSDIYKINHSNGEYVEISPETLEILSACETAWSSTNGAFDPTVRPLIEAWGFQSRAYAVPTPDQISDLLNSVGFDKLTKIGNTVSLPAESGLDLGAAAKGYACEKAASLLRERGVSAALLDLGGNIYSFGTKQKNEKFKIAVANPTGGEYLCLLEITNAAVATSGSYQRYFEQNGVKYHHILNPETGKPADSGILSVTVICESATDCDILSTALFISGESGIVRLSEHYDFEAVLLLTDGRLIATPGAAAMMIKLPEKIEIYSR